eukprot:gnl/Trimastix_PCT/3760.p1 GENE.gnl/Trimastix_PCT/3760~~gnl/Trimastix_PCT/3760.p1  ORF type:complete len:207 (+),score=19.08 gnl/Trimastix_PCT/3760:70-690(+)
MDSRRPIKILVIGDLSVGKTSVISRFVHNEFRFDYRTTMGAQLARKTVNVDGRVVCVDLLDLSGQDRFRSISRVFYRGAAGALVICDAHDPKTLEGALAWKTAIDQEGILPTKEPIPSILLANKTDLGPQLPDDMTGFCEQHGFLTWFATSAKENTNVTPAIHYLLSHLLQSGMPLCALGHEDSAPVDVEKAYRPVTVKPKKKCCG